MNTAAEGTFRAAAGAAGQNVQAMRERTGTAEKLPGNCTVVMQEPGFFIVLNSVIRFRFSQLLMFAIAGGGIAAPIAGSVDI